MSGIGGGLFTSTGVILVLFILLVIVSRGGFGYLLFVAEGASPSAYFFRSLCYRSCYIFLRTFHSMTIPEMHIVCVFIYSTAVYVRKTGLSVCLPIFKIKNDGC
jgi:hypothetical protein